MNVTNDMLQAAIKKAVEAGLLPRHASGEEMRINRELIQALLQAAVDAAPRKRSPLTSIRGERLIAFGELSGLRRQFAARK